MRFWGEFRPRREEFLRPREENFALAIEEVFITPPLRVNPD